MASFMGQSPTTGGQNLERLEAENASKDSVFSLDGVNKSCQYVYFLMYLSI